TKDGFHLRLRSGSKELEGGDGEERSGDSDMIDGPDPSHDSYDLPTTRLHYYPIQTTSTGKIHAYKMVFDARHLTSTLEPGSSPPMEKRGRERERVVGQVGPSSSAGPGGPSGLRRVRRATGQGGSSSLIGPGGPVIKV
ncbi:hypothetical protein ACLOJK_023319, partial [Asimina triloba]